jgi:energy-coupling factor transport system ATP-binding protein
MTELRLEGLAYEFEDGVSALDGVDLAIPGGQTVALIGANGSGKTTLLRHLDGLLRPARGRVLVEGKDAARLHVARLARIVGLGFQHPDRQIFAGSVRDEVEFGPSHQGLTIEEAFARVQAALGAVGMAGDLGRHPDDLGETQRKLLTIAAVLAMETPVVALDEPTTGLDSGGIACVQRIVSDLHAEGRTVIVASHDLRFVAETFERVVLLDRGRVVLDGPPAEVFAEAVWPTLRAARLEPPAAARIGARMGLGSTPTEDDLVAALEARS